MKFLDEARIEVKAGNGGAGMSHFRREKFVPLGGPDGGDGGNGGSVIVVADRRKQSLLDFHMRPIWQAKDGKPGGTNCKQGKSASDLILKVPVGTQIYTHEDARLVCDLKEDAASFVLAQGGRGGKGNAHFKSSTNRAPTYSQAGENGEGATYSLILKLVADIGLLGLPNAGKSTLISRISSAKPKIANYPFTTLVPNLGVVKSGELSFVVADIPGLIPGAHEGKGLGIKFLKHVERARLLVHLIDCNQILEDIAQGDPPHSYSLIRNELACYSPDLAERERMVLFTKLDTLADHEKLAPGLEAFKALGRKVIPLSAVSGQGIAKLIQELGENLRVKEPI